MFPHTLVTLDSSKVLSACMSCPRKIGTDAGVGQAAVLISHRNMNIYAVRGFTFLYSYSRSRDQWPYRYSIFWGSALANLLPLAMNISKDEILEQNRINEAKTIGNFPEANPLVSRPMGFQS